MNLHANARTCPNSRELLARRVIDEGWSGNVRRRGAGSLRSPSSRPRSGLARSAKRNGLSSEVLAR